MHYWESIFSSYLNSGVFDISQPAVSRAMRKAAKYQNLDFTRISLKGVVSKEHFLKKIAGALDFPDYFGLNWDALSDMLTDLSWKPANGYAILISGFSLISGPISTEIPLIKNIFASAAGYWKEKNVPFFIVLS